MTGLWVGVTVAALLVGFAGRPSRTRERLAKRVGTRTHATSGGPAEVADLVENIALGVGAGLSVRAAVETAAVARGSVASTIHRELAAGRPVADVLELVAATEPHAQLLVGPLVASLRFGTPVAAALERIELEVRAVQRRAVERRARRLPVQLLFPLVLCVLPAFVLVILVPVISVALDP